MEAPAGEFNFTQLEKVIFGPGTVEKLGAEIEHRGYQRALVVTGKTLGASTLLAQVTAALGASCAGVFKGAQEHTPSATVKELVKEIRRLQADCLVGFGGGSPIDCAKAAAASILTGWEPGARIRGIAFEGAFRSSPGAPELIQIALPTTLSAAEYTPAGGVTDESSHLKGAVVDARLQPRTIILDPNLTAATPDWLWVATGIRALDHAVEGGYSIRHQLLTDTLAAKAIALLTVHLPASIRTQGAERVAHRGQCQLAAWLSIFGGMNTRFGISHALGHQIGPRWKVPHGITSCITLPHVMRFMAEIAPERFGAVAEGYGISFDPASARASALECAERTAQFIAQFEVARRLRDVGVAHAELGEIADMVFHEVDRARTVGRPISREQIVALLEAAY